jgi:hypothetical protein
MSHQDKKSKFYKPLTMIMEEVRKLFLVGSGTASSADGINALEYGK